MNGLVQGFGPTAEVPEPESVFEDGDLSLEARPDRTGALARLHLPL
jgi:hypothetical protein